MYTYITQTEETVSTSACRIYSRMRSPPRTSVRVDLVHEPGVAVGVVGALWGLRAVTRVLTSHLAPLLPDPHVLILDSAVFVWVGTYRFGGTLTVQFTAEGTLSTIDVLVSEDLLT